MNFVKILTALTLTAGLALTATTASAKGKPVGITPKLADVTVKHNGKDVKIMRNQDNGATVDPAFGKTSRPCPPFCIQPMNLGKGIQTIGEVEVINYAKK